MSELKANIKGKFAESFLESLKKEQNYLFLGKVDSWETDSPLYLPGSPSDSLFEENKAKKSILCAYKLYEDDASLCIPRIDWESGTVYTEYDDRKELDKNNLNYYVVCQINSSYRVYKCLNNGNNAPSVVQPSGTSTEEEYHSADGYVWKFMYEIPEDLEKFITEDFVPVPVLNKNFYTDERSLQVATQISAKKGTIEEINFSYSNENFNSLTFTDIINQDYSNPSCVVLAKQQDTDNSVFITIDLSDLDNPTYLSNESNYYNDNYIAIFQTISQGSIVATIKNYTVNTTDGTRATIELCDVVGDPNNIQIGVPYSIVPKIIINGDGSEAVAIPIFQNYELVDIELVLGGLNYIRAEAYFAISTPYILNPIISPNKGHGSSAHIELNAKNVILTKFLTKHTNGSSGSDRFYFGNGNNVHQFGIINGLESIDGSILGTEKPLDEITLIKLNSRVEFVIPFYDNFEGEDASFFNVNDIITRGSAFKLNQFRAKVLSVEPNSDGETVVLMELQNGKFENYPNLNLKNETNNRTLNIVDETDEISVTYINIPKPDDYQNATHILGNETLFTGTIKQTNLFEEFIKISYLVEGIEKDPITSYYSSIGNLIPGEPVTLLIKNQNNTFSVVENNFMNVLEIVPKNSTIDTCYSFINKLTVNSRSIEYPSETLNQNSFILDNSIQIDKYIITKDLQNYGRVVHVEYLNENTEFPGSYESANVYIRPEKGTFLEFETAEDKELFILENTDPYSFEFESELLQFNGFCDGTGLVSETNSQNLDLNSGQIIYLENIRYITLNDSQTIKVNIVLEF